MSALRAALRALVGLFVDDGALAILALLWVAAVAWLLPLFAAPAGGPALLFAGLAAVLAVSVLRA